MNSIALLSLSVVFAGDPHPPIVTPAANDDVSITETTTTTTSTPPTCKVGINPANTKTLCTVNVDWSQLQSTGPQTYDIAMVAKSQTDTSKINFNGVFTMQTEVGNDSVTLMDHWEIMGRQFDLTMKCADAPLLPLMTGEIVATRNGETRSVSCTVENEKLHVNAAEINHTAEFPTGTVLQTAIFRMVSQLPRTAGQAWTFQSCTEPIEFGLVTPEPGQTFNVACVGPTKVETRNGNVVECTQYTINADEPVNLFVNAQSKVCKIVADEGTMIMMLRDEVMATQEPNADH